MYLRPRSKAFICLSLFLFCTAAATWNMLNQEIAFASSLVFSMPFLAAHRSGRPAIHGVVDEIYVISLRHRECRRKEMERLRRILGWDWTYIDALNATSPLSYSIIHWVSQIRAGFVSSPRRKHAIVGQESLADFSWPNTIEATVHSTEQLRIVSDDLSDTAIQSVPQLASAAKDYDIPDFSPGLPEYRRLTLARIACWYSHLIAIQTAANRAAAVTGTGSTLILEDDVDMERDTEIQLSFLWPSLPEDWDIVFLGHCWSSESANIPLPLPIGGTTNFSLNHTGSRIHPSNVPKCTHAYALSRTGARRLLLHLTYPPFAFSRAIDQAFAWLVESKRLKSFSIVPKLVIQRKISGSDVSKGQGSSWKETLRDGILQ